MTWDIDLFKIVHVTLRKISDNDMRHCHFLKSTCDIGDPSSRATPCVHVLRNTQEEGTTYYGVGFEDLLRSYKFYVNTRLIGKADYDEVGELGAVR